LAGRFDIFTCDVAINQDVAPGESSADFTVLGDGRILATVSDCVAGKAPCNISVRVSGIDRLVLEVATTKWPKCHSVWLDPEIRCADEPIGRTSLPDCLWRTKITLPPATQMRRCIATVVSPGYADLLDGMLGSLSEYGNCPDALLVVFAVDADEECSRVISKHDALQVDCTSIAPVTASVKSVLYSVARVIGAEQFVCLDADTLIVGDITPLFHALDVCAESVVLASPDPYIKQSSSTLADCLVRFYQGQESDLEYLLDTPAQEARFTLLVNDGVFAAKRAGMLRLDRFMRSIAPRAPNWLDSPPYIGARNQFIFNLALARLGCGLALDELYNMLPSVRSLNLDQSSSPPRATCEERDVRIIHFAGSGRIHYPEMRRVFVPPAEAD
jgi:hypothetical protein